MDREFDQVAFGMLGAVPIAVSSVVFGAMHGAQWGVGILAGVAYALVVKRTGRFGDAVAAHATSNLLLAAWVLGRGDWGMW
jgi:CAAX prenyl protease-like protein